MCNLKFNVYVQVEDFRNTWNKNPMSHLTLSVPSLVWVNNFRWHALGVLHSKHPRKAIDMTNFFSLGIYRHAGIWMTGIFMKNLNLELLFWFRFVRTTYVVIAIQRGNIQLFDYCVWKLLYANENMIYIVYSFSFLVSRNY